MTKQQSLLEPVFMTVNFILLVKSASLDFCPRVHIMFATDVSLLVSGERTIMSSKVKRRNNLCYQKLKEWKSSTLEFKRIFGCIE